MENLLQVAADAATAAAAAAALGGKAFSAADIAAGEHPMQAWARVLGEQAPAAVLVHQAGPLPPEALWELRERQIPYALALADFSQICPTHRLWHRRGEICSGPSGLKCARCVFPRTTEWPLAWAQFRHRSPRWQAAMAGAEVLLAPTRFVRDAWLRHGAPASRLIVVPPLRPALLPPPPAIEPRREARTLVYAGGWDEANGANLLAQALERIEPPVVVLATGAWDAAGQAAFRRQLPAGHTVEFPGALDAAALDLCLRTARAAVVPSRWPEAYGPLLDAAQWAGAALAATAAGGMPERIIHGLNGFLADPDDPASLAMALESALEGAWDPAAAQRHLNATATATLATWRQLAAELPSPPAGLALRLGFGSLLTAAQAEFQLRPEQAEDYLRAALESPGIESIEPAEQAVALAARLPSRVRRVHLNHALACLHAGQFRRVLVLGAGLGDAVDWFQAWGLTAAGCAGDGLGGVPPSAPLSRLAARLGMPPGGRDFLPDALFLEASLAADPSALRRRFPSAQAILADHSDGVQVLD
ncbi:MAG: glycosyltransferase [Terriglobales bacterium]